MELRQKHVLITIWMLGNPKYLRSVADRFNITKSILFRVYRRICGAIANNLSGQYMKYPLISNWAPLGKMINFGSLAQRNVMDEWSNDPSLDHADQWSDESLSRVDLIDHWSENGFSARFSLVKDSCFLAMIFATMGYQHKIFRQILKLICSSLLNKTLEQAFSYNSVLKNQTLLPAVAFFLLGSEQEGGGDSASELSG